MVCDVDKLLLTSPNRALPQADEWPNFRWADLSPLLASDYQGWGFFMPQNIKEPNNLMPPELCAGSNYTEFLNGTWGWADTDCQAPYPFMCKVTRASLPPLHVVPLLCGHACNHKNTTLPVQQPCGHLCPCSPAYVQLHDSVPDDVRFCHERGDGNPGREGLH